jgi:hypothetical protein
MLRISKVFNRYDEKVLRTSYQSQQAGPEQRLNYCHARSFVRKRAAPKFLSSRFLLSYVDDAVAMRKIVRSSGVTPKDSAPLKHGLVATS